MNRDSSETQERRAIRRRWITLGETVAVLALVISALTLWNSYAERKHNEVNEQAAASASNGAAHVLRLKGTRTDKDRQLSLSPLRDDQTIQSQTVRFPSALGVAPVDTAGDPRIEAGWFDSALRKARAAAGRKETTAGDERLPVEIVTHYLVGGEDRTDDAIYEVGYRVESHLFGASVLLHGISLAEQAGKSGQARLDRLWSARMPAKTS